ncbi:retrovirus-related pol polyprotein from transposon TNT 1-94 [Tanacetum coccineum]
MKNKVEAQPRKVNKKNHIVEPIRDVNVKHSLSNANSEPICATCKKSMFDGVHDMCILDFMENVVQIILWYMDSRCSKHMTRNRSQLMNFVSKFMGTVRFGNDNIAKIMGYGDYQLGNVTISRVYYVEGLGHNLFSVRQFCDADLEVAFWKNTCFIHNLEGVDLLSGSRDTNLYKISLDDMLKTSPHVALGKKARIISSTKAKEANQDKLFLCIWIVWPDHVRCIKKGKRYILVIVDDYSRFTWVRFLRTKDEAPEAIIKASKIQVHLNATVCNVRTDNGTEFVNQTLREFMKMLASHIKHLLPALLSRTVFSKGETELLTRLHSLTLATSSSGLVPNTVSQQPCIPPNRDDWDHLFQPMFDEYFNPPTNNVSPVLEAAAPRAVVLADSLVSTSID